MELKTQEKNGLLLMPTAKVTKNVSAAVGGGNVLCSNLISIKTKAWLYSFRGLLRFLHKSVGSDNEGLTVFVPKGEQAVCHALPRCAELPNVRVADLLEQV